MYVQNLAVADGARLVDECYRRSLELLRSNCTAAGILACAESEKARARRYTNIFGRDAAICSLGMTASGEPDLIAAAERSLSTLAIHQAPNGQIPKYVVPETGEADFWYLGCIDATLWWLIALKHLDRQLPERGLGQRFAAEARKALNWLSCQGHPTFGLLQQNEASDWADIMPRSGFVLYTNALWYCVQRLYGLAQAEETRRYFNYLFMPFAGAGVEQRRAQILAGYVREGSRHRDTYLSFVNFSFWGDEVDVLGNSLAVLAQLPQEGRTTRAIVDALRKFEVDQPFPVRAVAFPIACESPLWRPYMQRHQQNLPHQYHNGGIWPFIGGFWTMTLAMLGMHAEAWDALVRLALLNQVNGWEFNEWFHGRSGAPMGMPGQSWNAALFVLAANRLRSQTGGGVWNEDVACCRSPLFG